MTSSNDDKKKSIAKRLKKIAAATPVESDPPPKATKPRRSAGKRSARDETYKFAEISVGGRQTIRCIVLDMSAGGVRVALDGSVSLPEQVRIRIVSAGVARIADVVWRNATEAGLKFAD